VSRRDDLWVKCEVGRLLRARGAAPPPQPPPQPLHAPSVLPSLCVGDVIAYGGCGASLEEEVGLPVPPGKTYFLGILTGQRKTQVDQYFVFARQGVNRDFVRGVALLSSFDATCPHVVADDDPNSGGMHVFIELAATVCTSPMLPHRPKPETLHKFLQRRGAGAGGGSDATPSLDGRSEGGDDNDEGRVAQLVELYQRESWPRSFGNARIDKECLVLFSRLHVRK